MKVAVLTENTTGCDFPVEHGLSLYIETKLHKILFDTGQSSLFLENAKRLGIDIGDVDICVLSHGHYDHGGGLKTFLENNSKANIYVNPYVFETHLHGPKNIGIDPSLEKNERLIKVSKDIVLDEELSIVSFFEQPMKYPVYANGLSTVRNGIEIPEDFRHEQYLMIQDKDRKICFSGCSHKGILNIMERIHPDILIGGFHLMRLDPQKDSDKLDRYSQGLSAYNTMYYTCHCTGVGPYEYLKKTMKSRLDYLSTGRVVEI